jgi:hypothetical protein
LDQVTEDCSAGRAVKENHFLHGKRSAKDHLVNVGHPRAVRMIVKLSIEVKLFLSASETWRRVEPRMGPAVFPLRQKQVM